MKYVRSSINGGCWHSWMAYHEMQRKMNGIFGLRKAGNFGSVEREATVPSYALERSSSAERSTRRSDYGDGEDGPSFV